MHANEMEHNGDTLDTVQKIDEVDPEDLDQDEIKKLVRKIDTRLMPIMCITYGLQYYDKVVLSHAAVFGLLEDLDMAAYPLRLVKICTTMTAEEMGLTILTDTPMYR
ncbi:major facilitator superfamily domain-containing protein [Penicillium angulare]|uniref:Major facilitator superfamily domain-containing protein n=1 Tax=Penicillium angulare TaxID=116970 RepID=A0A9W9ESS5_9EURO|nr:major facilitator superfamily domain-containing protein [Penicillium angulare]